MVDTPTTRHGFVKPDLNDPGWAAKRNTDLNSLDLRLPWSHAGDPNTEVAGEYVGQPIYDSTNGILYLCTLVGDAATAEWTGFTGLSTVPDGSALNITEDKIGYLDATDDKEKLILLQTVLTHFLTGAMVLSGTADFNTLVTPGHYNTAGATYVNPPLATANGALVVMSRTGSGDDVSQVWYNGNASGIYYRMTTDGGTVWTPWVNIADTTVGRQTVFIPAAAMYPSATNGAETDEREIATSLIVAKSMAFPQSVNRYAQFAIAMPKSWNKGTVSAEFIWFKTTGTGDIRLGLQGVALANDDLLTTAFGTIQYSTDTALANNDVAVTPETPAITLGNTPSADTEYCVFRVERNGAHASDTLVQPIYLLGIKLFYNITKGTDA